MTVTTFAERAMAIQLRATADRLTKWVAEIDRGSWSTQHKQPMIDEAQRIYALLGKHGL